MTDGDTPVGDILGDDTGEAQQEEPDDGYFVAGEASCNDCAKQSVCAIYANAGDMLQQMAQRTGSEPPLEAEELAFICGAYEPE